MGLGDRIQHWNEDTRRVNYAARTNGWVGGSGRCEKQNFAFQEKKGQMDDSIREIKIQIGLLSIMGYCPNFITRVTKLQNSDRPIRQHRQFSGNYEYRA